MSERVMAKDAPEPLEPLASTQFKPVLGLSDVLGERVSFALPLGTVYDQPEPEELIELTVIVPARNEEANLGECMQSLGQQSEPVVELGRYWALIVVNDYASDLTAESAHGFACGTLMQAD